ncbi:MAG: amino acid ABC transporter substrate-binding protein, partial [Gemmatimonadetes bacterium]|nr:amino acid ABC transporter substrate-binding protein [Gemmatimonadota bacterium]
MRTVVLAAAAAWLAACARDRGPIVIGAAGPLSQPLGVSLQRGMRLAVEQINARGGVAGGRLLELRFVDDSGSPDVAVRVAQALYEDRRVVAVVGHVTSGPTIAAARVYGAGSNPIPVISPSASSPELSGISPWFFRVCPTDVSHGPALARFARRRLAAQRAAVIYINDDYGRGVRQLFVSEFRRLGGQVLEEDPYVPATATLEPYLSRLRTAGGVDVLVLAAEPAGAELVLREMQRLGVRWPVIGGDGMTGIEETGALAEGLRVST